MPSRFIAVNEEETIIGKLDDTLADMSKFYKDSGALFGHRRVYKYIGTLNQGEWEEYADTPDTTDLAPQFITRKEGQASSITHTSEESALKWAEAQAKDDPGVTVETYRIIAQVKARKQPLIMDWVK